jgi:hypothetical protein
MLNKIIPENFANLKKEIPIQEQEVSRTPNKPEQVRTSPCCIIVKTTSTKNKWNEYCKL